MVSKLLKLNNYNPKFLNKVNKEIKISKNYPILLTKPNTHGQKYFEEFHDDTEKIYLDKKDKTISKR